jgi:hypothetical protein
MNGEAFSMPAMQPASQAVVPHSIPEPQPQAEGQQTDPGSYFGLSIGAITLLLALAGIGTGLVSLPDAQPDRVSHVTATAVEEQQPKPQLMPSLIRPAAAGEVEQAIAAVLTTDVEKARLRTEIASGRTRIGWLTILDSDVEDGDWVSVSAAGLSQQVRLYHAPTTIAVPYRPGLPVTVTGTVDGDGKSITVAVRVGAASFVLAPMQVGTSVQVPTP